MIQLRKHYKNIRAKVNFAYNSLFLLFGLCIGYYLMPHFFRVPEKVIFDEGIAYGVVYYRDYLNRMGTFETVDDSTVLIVANHDSIYIYK